MKHGFPQFAPSAKQGDLGVSIISRIMSEGFGWLFKRNHQEHDFGIDGQIEIVTAEGIVTGQMLACQIKCGKSYFQESNRWGYVYRGETKHFNYLANYPLPVIITLCDPESREVYWTRFRAVDAHITEGGWKLTIPFDNKLSSSKDALQAMLPVLADYLSPLKEYWRVNNMLFGVAGIVLMVDSKEVVAKDVSRVTDFWRRLCATKELALHCQGKIEIGIYGYDDDPRELFEIEEVRQFIRILDEALPELFFFACAGKPATTLMLFVFCLAGISWEGERSTPGDPRKYIVDFGMLGPFLERHFSGLNLIAEWLGLSEKEIERMSKASAKMIGCLPPQAEDE